MAAICGSVKADVCVCIGALHGSHSPPSPTFRRWMVYFGEGDGSKRRRRRGAIGRRRMLGNPADYAEFIPLSLSHSPAHTYTGP